MNKTALRKLINDWLEAKAQLTEWKERESILRGTLVHHLFPNAAGGTNKKDLGFAEAKATVSFRIAVDSLALKEATSELPRKLKSTVTKTSYSLNRKVYDTLTEEQKEKFDECLTLTPNKPTLAIELYDVNH